MSPVKPLSEILAGWRAFLGIDAAEAARVCEVSRQLWAQLEGGETKDPRVSTLLTIQRGTGIPMDRLLAGVEAQLDRVKTPA